MNSLWKKADSLIKECSIYISEQNNPITIGRFRLQFRHENGFIFTFANADNTATNTEIGLFNENRLMLNISDGARKRGYTLEESFITDSASSYDIDYPTFCYHWENNEAGGRLVFFRVDLNLDTFVNYSAENGFRAEKHGHKEEYSDLPDNIAEIDNLLGQIIPHSLNYDERAQEILNISGLEEFTSACKKFFTASTTLH